MIDEEAMRMLGWQGGDGDAAYLDKTLRYQPIELSLDESVGWQVVKQLLLRAVLAAGFVLLAFAFLAVVIGVLSRDTSELVALFSISYICAFLVFWVVLLFSKLPEPIAEWRVLLGDRGDRVASAYSQIVGTLRHRQLPINGSSRRVRTGLGPQQVSNRLVLTEGKYVVYVSVFSYGTSLYLGWMMWRTRLGAALIKQFIMDVVEGILGRNDPELRMLRTERPRAMREAVHAACREGLFVAIDGRDVPESYGFPQGLPPIEDSVPLTAPVPGMPASAGRVPDGTVRIPAPADHVPAPPYPPFQAQQPFQPQPPVQPEPGRQFGYPDGDRPQQP